jgi:hypothetical protein
MLKESKEAIMSNAVAATATSAREWKGKRQTSAGPLDLPSGNTALVKQLDPTVFLDAEMVPNPLLNIIRKAINDQKGLPPQALKKISEDSEMLASTMLLFDRVLCRVVEQPVIQMPPPCVVCNEYANTSMHTDAKVDGYHAYREGERDEDILYADQVEMDDKVFIFQWCLGGTRDLEKFREQQEANVGSLSGRKDVQRTPK